MLQNGFVFHFCWRTKKTSNGCRIPYCCTIIQKLDLQPPNKHSKYHFFAKWIHNTSCWTTAEARASKGGSFGSQVEIKYPTYAARFGIQLYPKNIYSKHIFRHYLHVTQSKQLLSWSPEIKIDEFGDRWLGRPLRHKVFTNDLLPKSAWIQPCWDWHKTHQQLWVH